MNKSHLIYHERMGLGYSPFTLVQVRPFGPTGFEKFIPDGFGIGVKNQAPYPQRWRYPDREWQRWGYYFSDRIYSGSHRAIVGWALPT
jgi:hypothetical protein